MKVSLGMLFLCVFVVQLLCVNAFFRRRRRRRRRSPPVVNCVWSNWQPWSACSSTWQGWSPCSVSCGSGGTQTRVRTKARSEFCGGSACTGISHQQRSCSGYSPVDCAWGDWHEWTACSVTCGSGGTQTRTRCVETSEYCGGTTCSEPSEQQRSCSRYSPVNCAWGDWQEWTACSVTCGSGGTQTRTRCVETSEYCGGTTCSEPSEQQISCSGESINCVWGDWQEWTSCSVTCGNGTQTRIRIVMTPESCGGMTCNGLSEQHKTCENQNTCVCSQGCMRGTASSDSCVDCPFPYTGSCCEQLIDEFKSSNLRSDHR
ncbi:spondin-1-like [Antedon mediterranea]|uniref:spondin-1-like n=1 Tax=Antedon mediterranea TaxID=105859 RepID=UPI003AF86E0D